MVVIRATIQFSPRKLLPHATPLFEKEWNLRFVTLAPNADDPVLTHWACAGTAFATNDDPVNLTEIELVEVFKQRLDG